MARNLRLIVSGPDGKRPFLRGILAHSLLQRGLSFKEAIAVANLTRGRLEEEARLSKAGLEVTTAQLRALVWQLVEETCGEQRRVELTSAPAQTEPLIVQPEGVVPFSRGLLAQHLAGTGLDPRYAYEVAQEVFGQVRLRPGGRIDERDLHQLVRDSLVERHGRAFGERYDAIDIVARSRRPIIVLLGGATGCGKSTLATEIAYRLGIRKVASTDMIREVMRMLLSPDILPSIHVSSFKAPCSPGQKNPLLGGFIEQVMRVEVGITASIRRAVLENFHLIVEGIHVVPPMACAAVFRKRAILVPVVVATHDRAVLASRFARRGKERHGDRAKRYLHSLDDILAIQDYIIERAKKHKVPVVDNVSFDQASNDLLTVITDRIHAAIRRRSA
jgi:2-phosphoglycerate kinase